MGLDTKVYWIGLNGHGQIVGLYPTQQQASANTAYVVGMKMSTLKAVCTCARPAPHTRPSGAVICTNEQCGGHIQPAQEKKDRP
jgi:hypothetical protein